MHDDDESDDERRNRQLTELLNELRVALPGVQMLFGFLLAVPFSARFTSISENQRHLYYVTFLAAALASVCFIAPTSFHRIVWERHLKRRLIHISSGARAGRDGLPGGGDRLRGGPGDRSAVRHAVGRSRFGRGRGDPRVGLVSPPAGIPAEGDEPSRLTGGPCGYLRSHVSSAVAPELSARAAGLRYVSDDKPGISRRKRGKGFSYRDAQGKPVAARRVAEIKALAIPAGVDGRVDLPLAQRPPAGHGARRARAQAVPLPPRVAGNPR